MPSSAVKDHVHPPTVSSSGDLAAFLRVFLGIFGLYARRLLFTVSRDGQREGSEQQQSPASCKHAIAKPLIGQFELCNYMATPSAFIICHAEIYVVYSGVTSAPLCFTGTTLPLLLSRPNIQRRWRSELTFGATASSTLDTFDLIKADPRPHDIRSVLLRHQDRDGTMPAELASVFAHDLAILSREP